MAGKEDLFERLKKHKVLHVVKTAATDKSFCEWFGTLDNDHFFVMWMSGDMIFAGMSEREMLVRQEMVPTIVFDNPHEPKVGNDIKSLFDNIKEVGFFISDLFNEIEFDDIMEIFMWEYISNKVEVYENISL